MRRYYAYLLLMMVAIALAVPFILPLEEGQPLLDWRDLAGAAKRSTAITQTLAAPSEPRQERVRLMRWQDKNHQWHFSQSAPDDGSPYETIFVDPNNSLVSLPSPEPFPTAERASDTFNNTDRAISPSPYTPAEIAQLLQEARNAQALLRERHAQQASVLSGSPTQR